MKDESVNAQVGVDSSFILHPSSLPFHGDPYSGIVGVGRSRPHPRCSGSGTGSASGCARCRRQEHRRARTDQRGFPPHLRQGLSRSRQQGSPFPGLLLRHARSTQPFRAQSQRPATAGGRRSSICGRSRACWKISPATWSSTRISCRRRSSLRYASRSASRSRRSPSPRTSRRIASGSTNLAITTSLPRRKAPATCIIGGCLRPIPR